MSFTIQGDYFVIEAKPSIANYPKGTSVSSFLTHSPKSDTINAVKLTKENLRSVGAHIVKASNAGVVRVGDDRITIMDSGFVPRQDFTPGDHIVEDYDYDKNVVFFRLITLDERKKFDLR